LLGTVERRSGSDNDHEVRHVAASVARPLPRRRPPRGPRRGGRHTASAGHAKPDPAAWPQTGGGPALRLFADSSYSPPDPARAAYEARRTHATPTTTMNPSHEHEDPRVQSPDGTRRSSQPSNKVPISAAIRVQVRRYVSQRSHPKRLDASVKPPIRKTPPPVKPVLRACVVCGRPSPDSRCPRHATPRDNGHARPKRLAAQVLREELVCHLCGKVGTADDPLTIDHLIPVSRGGQTVRENLAAAHRSCNSRRGATMQGQRAV
jgi:5-methylcytosine-specific restriction endonuclease McrA